MTKLPEDKKFFDVSDYARPFAVVLVKKLLPTRIGAYSLTFAFLIVGLLASYLIYIQSIAILPAALIILKSMLDAADGEIARQRKEPSMVGRYLDSIFDFIVNLFLFLSIALINNQPIWLMLIALLLFQIQGSIFNYYYLVKRYQVNGDKTSRIFERETPKAFPRDNLKLLKVLHKIYLIIYGWQDSLVHKLDPQANMGNELSNWFLTMVSFLGLGFQLLIISIFIILGIHEITIPFFIFAYSGWAVGIILIRRVYIKQN